VHLVDHFYPIAFYPVARPPCRAPALALGEACPKSGPRPGVAETTRFAGPGSLGGARPTGEATVLAKKNATVLGKNLVTLRRRGHIMAVWAPTGAHVGRPEGRARVTAPGSTEESGPPGY